MNTNVVELLQIVVVVMVAVLVAMGIDLASGLRKAKERGEMRTSYGLSRTLTKFLMYEGGVVIATCIDICIHCSHIYELIGCKILNGVPLITCLVGVFLCIVEGLSLREKADEKQRKKMSDASKVIGSVISKTEFAEAIAEAIKRSLTENKDET